MWRLLVGLWSMGAAAAPVTLGARVEACPIALYTGSLPRRLVVAQGALHGEVEATQTALLLRHPKGNYLIDGGQRVDLAGSLDGVPAVQRAMLAASAGGFRPVRPLATVAPTLGPLQGAILTHAHYDHVGGLLEVPGLPILTTEAELAEARRAAAGEATNLLPVDARGLIERGVAVQFDGPAVGPYPVSHDLYGDGSVILVPMSGHTPGSLGVFIHTQHDERVFLVGDTVWVREGYELNLPKSAVAARFDSDGAATAAQIAALHDLYREDPGLVLVPAHDGRQWEAAFGTAACAR